jgi:DNA repair protein RadD
MPFTLHPFQQQLVDTAAGHLAAGARSVLIQAPTGAGKTVITSSIFDRSITKGRRSWFIVHRRELVLQAVRTFEEAGVPTGVVAAGWPMHPGRPVQVCSVGSLRGRLRHLMPPDLVVWDECHHCAAKTWGDLHAALPKARHVGLTATPERLDGAGLGDYFDEMVVGPSTAWLIENKYLAPFRYFAAPKLVLDNVATTAGDYNKGQLAAAIDKPAITGDAVSHYLRVAPGRRAVAFAVKIEHSRHIVESFLAAGVPACHVDGETPTHERDRAVAAFRAGEIKVLSNVDLFGEGFDLPALEVAILLRPTKSLGLYLQQVGRALRTSPGKTEAIILDHASNVGVHGMPDDERGWALTSGRRQKKGVAGPSVRICEDCFAAVNSRNLVCPECGCVFPAEEREINEVAGDLQEVSQEARDALRRERNREQAAAKTFDELLAIGKRRGYRNPAAWARILIQARANSRNTLNQPAFSY